METSRREMILTTLAALGAASVPQIGSADTPDGTRKPAVNDANPFPGKWTYRSFNSNPDASTPPDKLIFGIGEMTIEAAELGQFKGKLVFDSDVLQLRGTIGFGSAVTARFQGIGSEGTAKSDNWVYDYIGFLIPNWPNGVAQRPAIVGSIVRTLPHSEGKAKAGVVNCWIAVKQELG